MFSNRSNTFKTTKRTRKRTNPREKFIFFDSDSIRILIRLLNTTLHSQRSFKSAQTLHSKCLECLHVRRVGWRKKRRPRRTEVTIIPPPVSVPGIAGRGPPTLRVGLTSSELGIVDAVTALRVSR